MGKKKKFKTGQIFDTLADVGSLFMAILYILYVALLLIFEFGTPWLNYCMLGITFFYIIFFALKMTTLNKIIEMKNVQRKTRFILKYSKWSMKLINAIFITLLIATASRHDSGNIFMMIGVFIAIFSFVISIMWDVGWYIARRRMREFRTNWNTLSRQQKNARISTLLEDFLQSLDYLTGADVSEKLTVGGQRTKKQDQEEQQQEPPQEES